MPSPTFKYKKNAFLIIDPNKELATGASFLLDDSHGKYSTAYLYHSNSWENKDYFKAAIAFNHELTHYIQELMFNACICDGYTTDYIMSLLTRASHIKNIKFPLPFDDDYSFYQILSLVEFKDDMITLKQLKKFVEIYNAIFIKSYQDNHLEKYGINIPDEEKNKYNISFKDIIESHAYHKAFWDYFVMNQTEGNSCDLLHSISVDENIFPYSFENGCLKCRDFKRNIYWRKPYMLPFYLMIKSFPLAEMQKAYVDYCNQNVPFRYSESVGNWMHTLFLLIIETSLGIPSIEYIYNQVLEGADIKQFSPAYRFFKILDTISKNSDFLFNTVEGENYLITFFNHIAADNKWLNYEATAWTMQESLKNRAEKGKEVIVNYQKHLWQEKYKEPKQYIHFRPSMIVGHFALPVLIQQDHGIHVDFHAGNLILDQSVSSDFYTEYFLSEIKRYQILEGSKDKDELFTKIIHNSHGAVREIVNRLFAADTREAYTHNFEYRCPLAKGGCQNSCPQCASFKSFNEVTSNCKNEILRYDKFNGYKRYIGCGLGNTPDCMYLNYMLDNGFDINNLNFK